MWKTGEFWDNHSSKREYCFKIIPKKIAEDVRQMTLYAFELVYQALGGLGYKFRDAGHNSEYVIISLNKAISKKHLKQLEDAFSITEDCGNELAFV